MHQALADFLLILETLEQKKKDRPNVFSSDMEFIKKYDLRADKQHFDFEGFYGWSHLTEPYEDDHPVQVYMAGAQSGKSIRVMVRILRAALESWGGLYGYYFPDFHLPRAFSSTRFVPFVNSSPDLAKWLGAAVDDQDGIENALTMTLGASTLFFLSIAGRSTTEGLPMRGLFFDEVRRMAAGDIQRAEERDSAQLDPINFKVSTAYYPDSDIHSHFLLTDQRHFHTFCKCPGGCVLSLSFPDCIVEIPATGDFRRAVEHAYVHAGLPYLGMRGDELARYGEAVYLCPKCGTILTNPRDGWWEPHNPGAYGHGYQMPQMLSPVYPAARAFRKMTTATDKREILNSLVGLPYLDPDAVPVQHSHLMSCVESSLTWAAKKSETWRRRNLKRTAMGIDAMGGYNCIVIKELATSGKYRTIHIEIAHGDDPWLRCRELMVEYDVFVCVTDCNPHWNEAHRFAKDFEGRIWLAHYSGGESPLVSWGDRARAPESQRKAGREAGFKYTVAIHRTRGLQWSLKRWVNRRNEVPDPGSLIQTLPVQNGKVILTPGLRAGRMTPTPICSDVYFVHQQKVAFEKTYAPEDTKKIGPFAYGAVHIGLDPHFAHANLYADIALARVGAPQWSEGQEGVE